MAHQLEHIDHLCRLYFANEASREQVEELMAFLKDPAHDEVSKEMFFRALMSAQDHDTGQLPADTDLAWNQLLQHPPLGDLWQQQQAATAHTGSNRPLHRIHFLHQWGWAAAIIFAVIISAAAYFLFKPQREHTQPTNIASIKTDISPGAARAILTLADGTAIALDSAGAGALAQQGNATIIKKDNGQIAYNVKGATEKVMMNTMHTPRGGQYKLALPDGSIVWLNAESSIRFPATFTGNTRTVSVSGEVYMEISKDESKPFLVDVNGKTTVQVLGTGFNINAYADDGVITTTLVEGKVKVGRIPGADAGKHVEQPEDAVILQPSQQAIIPDQHTALIKVVNADVAQTLAWKNGTFNFTGKSFQSTMKDIERWYDIQIKYEGPVPGNKLKGKMDRDIQLPDLIRFLQGFGLHVKQEGRTLIIAEK
jgi:transmembrane sensor